ncbi:class I SAM-dependent methyltransferase [Deinococcus maricopensis]|uniref:Methyltransferase type 11 n=1 Tax=Deinococcus maricopensis (strain DSM 21211 / LMG 22137 / NRRL B-23946 / LB-34) TaxID=709986 RepID=E8U7V7_DEIML|nr:class I SAM-dependent methyltransferase [Deinococcus maricopensis]ADV67146.1 Methyltransferase type 11 [Deinococcus maricopensis DSM 21211]
MHTERFTGRAASYVTGRPTYPAALTEMLRDRDLLREGVADVGAGTGLFTRLLLDAGAHVDAVEPNPGMRAQLEAALTVDVQSGRLRVHAGTADATGLAGGSVGLVAAAQAAHWFTPGTAVPEFRRVLRAGGRALLVWNDWRGQAAGGGFTGAYAGVVGAYAAQVPSIEYGVPFAAIAQFLPGGFEHLTFPNPLTFTRERLHALVGSVSYLPAPGTPEQTRLLRHLDAAFERHAQGGVVMVSYVTHAFLGAP